MLLRWSNVIYSVRQINEQCQSWKNRIQHDFHSDDLFHFRALHHRSALFVARRCHTLWHFLRSRQVRDWTAERECAEEKKRTRIWFISYRWWCTQRTTPKTNRLEVARRKHLLFIMLQMAKVKQFSLPVFPPPTHFVRSQTILQWLATFSFAFLPNDCHAMRTMQKASERGRASGNNSKKDSIPRIKFMIRPWKFHRKIAMSSNGFFFLLLGSCPLLSIHKFFTNFFDEKCIFQSCTVFAYT